LWVVGVAAIGVLSWLLAVWVSSAAQVVLVRLTPAPQVVAAKGAEAAVGGVGGGLSEQRNVFQVQRPQAQVQVSLGGAQEARVSAAAEVAAAAEATAPAAAVEEPSGPKRSDLPVTLLATMVASERAHSLAFVIDHPTQGEQTLRVGQPLYDGVVVRVERTRVWVRRQGGRGGLEYLALGEAGGGVYVAPPPLPLAPPRGLGAPASAGGDVVASEKGEIRVHEGARPQGVSMAQLLEGVDPASLIKRDAQGTFHLDMRAAQRHADALREVADGMRLSAATDAQGQVVGVRIGEVAKGSLLAELGLEAQDVIVSVNGEQPTDERAALAFLEALARGEQAQVMVERRGRRLPLTLQTTTER
jgi:hypothetical protein